MKTTALTRNTIGTYSKGLLSYRLNNQKQYLTRIGLLKLYAAPAANAASVVFKKAIGKISAKYFMDAANELLKQNLLGTDINMEFLTLSIRAYTSLIFWLIAKNAATFNFQPASERRGNFSSTNATYSFTN